MSSLGFDYGPFHAFVSSHGHYGIAVHDLPWWVDSPLPGLLEHGRAEALNETWESEGRQPEQLVGTDDDMPDLEDPRLEKCLRAYVERHWESLQRRHAEAKQHWIEMQQHTLVVKGVSLRPGQRVRLYFAGPPPINGDEFTFHFIDSGGRIFLRGENGVRSHKLGSADRLEPVDPE